MATKKNIRRKAIKSGCTAFTKRQKGGKPANTANQVIFLFHIFKSSRVINLKYFLDDYGKISYRNETTTDCLKLLTNKGLITCIKFNCLATKKLLELHTKTARHLNLCIFALQQQVLML